jgi:glycerol-3-phosphate dehydrogenase
MAEKASDMVCAKLGISAGCVTAKEVMVKKDDGKRFPGLSAAQSESLVRRYGIVPSDMLESVPPSEMCVQSCSCENVMMFEIEHYAASYDVLTVADLMRRTRAGMGFCQGTACMWNMASALSQEDDAGQLVRDFVKERREGSSAILEGDQLRQEVFRSHRIWPYEERTKSGGGR